MPETFTSGRTIERVRKIETVQGKRDFRVVTSPVVDEARKVYAGICLYEDFTEKLLLERDLRQSQKLEAVGQLAAGIAHEINTPMQYIGDNIRFLNDSFQDITKLLQACLPWQKAAGKEELGGNIHCQLVDAIEEADIAYYLDETTTWTRYCHETSSAGICCYHSADTHYRESSFGNSAADHAHLRRKYRATRPDPGRKSICFSPAEKAAGQY